MSGWFSGLRFPAWPARAATGTSFREMCALFDTLIGDADGVYDPGWDNDRLLLGLKGTTSEAELHILKGRMHKGRRAKAERGELVMGLPRGFVLKPSGEVALDPDKGVRPR